MGLASRPLESVVTIQITFTFTLTSITYIASLTVSYAMLTGLPNGSIKSANRLVAASF